MNPFKKSSSAPAAASGTPTNTRGSQAQATGSTAQGQAAAAPGRGQADTGHQDGARDGPTPSPGRAQPPAEDGGHEGKSIDKIRTKLVEQNPVKIREMVSGEFPGSDPDFSPDPDQKSHNEMGGPGLAGNRSDLGDFYGSDPEFSSEDMEFTLEWGNRALDSGYKSFFMQDSPGHPDLSLLEQNWARKLGNQSGHLARLDSGSESDSESDFCPNTQSSPVNRAGSLRQGKMSFPPPSRERPGSRSSARSFEPDGGGEGQKTGPNRSSRVSETESDSGDFWEDSKKKRGGARRLLPRSDTSEDEAVLPLAQARPLRVDSPVPEANPSEDSSPSSKSSISDYISEDLWDSDEIAENIGVLTETDSEDEAPRALSPAPPSGPSGPLAHLPEARGAGASSMDDFAQPQGRRARKILQDFESSANLVLQNNKEYKKPKNFNTMQKPENLKNVSPGRLRGGTQKGTKAVGAASPEPAKGNLDNKTAVGIDTRNRLPADSSAAVALSKQKFRNYEKRPPEIHREEIRPLPATWVDQIHLFKDELIRKGLSWADNQFCHSEQDPTIYDQAFENANDLGFESELVGMDREGLTVWNSEWLAELRLGLQEEDTPFGDSFDVSDVQSLEVSIRTAKKLPPDRFWGEGANIYKLKPCKTCKKANKYYLFPPPAPRLTSEVYEALRTPSTPPDKTGQSNPNKFVFSGPSRVVVTSRSGRRCTQLDLSQEREGNAPPSPPPPSGETGQPMPPPPPPANPPQAGQPQAEAEASDLGSGSDRPVDHSEARKDKTEGARAARKARPGKKPVMRSPGKNMQEGQVRALTGFKTKPKGKPRAGSSGGKPASKARGASGGAARRERPEESPKYSPEDSRYDPDPDYVDLSSEEEERRHNNTPTSSTLLRGGSPAPYAALARYGGYEGDVSVLEQQPSTSGRGQGHAQGEAARGQEEASLNTPSPPGPHRRSPNGPNITRLPPEMRRHHHRAPPGLSLIPSRPRGPPEASYTIEDAFGEFRGDPPCPSSTPLHAQEEDEVLQDAFNLSGELTSQEREPGQGQPPLDISSIRGTPTRDENTPPTPPDTKRLREQELVFQRGERLMEEIRRAERRLGIEGTPIQSLQDHPDLPAVLASEVMRQRCQETSQDLLGEAVSAIGTPVRGVNIQVNIHAPQQVVNISPGRQSDPGDPNISSHMMLDPTEPAPLAEPVPGPPPTGAIRVGTGHNGAGIYLPPGVVAVPGAVFRTVGPGGNLLQHTIPNLVPQTPQVPPQLQIQHQDHQDQEEGVEEMEVDNPGQESAPPRHGGSFISALAHQALEGPPPQRGEQAENGVFTIVPSDTPDMVMSTGCFGHSRERSPSPAPSGASTVVAIPRTPEAKAADAQDAGQASGRAATNTKAPGGAPPPAKAANAQEVGQASGGHRPSRSTSKAQAPPSSDTNTKTKKPEEEAPPRDLPARHGGQRRSTSGGGSQTGRTPSVSSSRQDAASESGRRKKTGAARKAAKRTNTSRTLAALAILFNLDEGQRATTSAQWNSFCRIAGLDASRADPMEVIRALFQPDYSFARAFQTHSEANWSEGERGSMERANSLSLLRLLGAYWSMTKREQVRRGFCSPGSGHERTARGRLFYAALREGRIMSREEVDDRLEELRTGPAKNKAGGKQKPKSSGAPPPPPVTDTSSLPEPEEPGEPGEPRPGPSGAAQPPKDLRSRLSARTAPITPAPRSAQGEPGSGRRSAFDRLSPRRPPEGSTSTSRTGSNILDNMISSHSGNKTSKNPKNSKNTTKPMNSGSVSSSNASKSGKKDPNPSVSSSNANSNPNSGSGNSKNSTDTNNLSKNSNTQSESQDGNRRYKPVAEIIPNKFGGNRGGAARPPGTRPRRWDVPPPGTPQTAQGQTSTNVLPSVSGDGGERPAPGATAGPSATPSAAATTSARTVTLGAPPNGPQTVTFDDPGAGAGATAARAGADRPEAQARPVRERLAARPQEEGEEPPQVIIFGPGRARVEGQRLTDLRNGLIGVTIQRQLEGETISTSRFQRHEGHLIIDPQEGPGQRWSRQVSGDSLIALHNGRVVQLPDGSELRVEAVWNTDLPRVTEFTARFPGPVSEEVARQLVESPVAGIAVANGFSAPASASIRFVSARPFSDGSGDTLIRFEAGAEAVREIQRVVGVITIGCVRTTVWWNMAEITPETVITLGLPH